MFPPQLFPHAEHVGRDIEQALPSPDDERPY
jgi:hypothetical protein